MTTTLDNIKSKQKRTNTGLAIPGGINMHSGVGFVSKDELPGRREHKINISEVSKAQVMEFAPNGSMVATGH